MNDKLILCKDVALSEDEAFLCTGIDFSISNGDYMCVVTPDNRIKVAFSQTLMGFRKHSSGDIIYGNGFTSSDIGYLPRISECVGASLVRDMVLSGRLKRGFGIFFGKEDKKAAMDAMKLLGVDDCAKRRFGELSGGQKQKVLLARAICASKKMLILESPCIGLDVLAREELYANLSRLNREYGTTVITVSNNHELVTCYAKTILHISDRQLFFGSREEYLRSVPGQMFLYGRVM